MAEVKGKLITLTGSLVKLYPKQLNAVDERLHAATGEHWDELEPEGWYDAKWYKQFMDAYIEGSPTRDKALTTLGKQIYPFLKSKGELPDDLETPIDYIEFESEGYTKNLRGPEIKPRKFVKKEPGHVILRTKMQEQDCGILDGVFKGLMKLSGVDRGKITHDKCIKQGDPYCEFEIMWNPNEQ